MKKCLLCKKETIIFYGDGGQYGDSFCKECYDVNVCAHCRIMNIIIITEDNIINNHNKYIPPKEGEDYQVICLSLYGRPFKVFCKECHESGEPYKENEVVDVLYGCEEPDVRSEKGNETDDESDDYDNNIDAYYVRRGKHDLY